MGLMFGAPFFVRHVGRCPDPGVMKVTQVYFDTEMVGCTNGRCSYLFPFEDLIECEANGSPVVGRAKSVRETKERGER